MSSWAGALGQWLKLPAWNVGDRGLEPHSGLKVSNKQNVFFRSLVMIQYCAKTYNTNDTIFRSATLTKQIAHYKHEIKITRNGYFSLNHRHIQITLAQIRLEFSKSCFRLHTDAYSSRREWKRI